MIVRYSQIIKSPVLLYQEQAVFGFVFDVVIQKSDIAVKAIVVRDRGLFYKQKLVSFHEIVAIESDSVTVQKEESAVGADEAPSIALAIGAGMAGSRRMVVTKNGKRVGLAYDYTIESESGLITSIYVKSWFSDRIIGREAILSIEKRKIIIDDDYELVKNSAALAEGN